MSALASLSLDVEAAVINGKISSNGKPLAEVIVTDGFSFTVTNLDGGYSIDTHQRAEFVYILTPKGYVADYSTGIPQFYQRLEEDKDSYNFELRKMKGDPDKSVMLALADPQLDKESDKSRLFGETLPDIKRTVSAYPDSQICGIMLGDLSWDVYMYNSSIKDFAKDCGIPFYPVIGNHDYDKYMTPVVGADFAHFYKQDFGPLYYAFQFGDAYYVVLNSIEYHGNKAYKETLENEDQMKWLALLLNCVLQQDKNVRFAMHAPFKPSPESGLIPGGDLVKKMSVNKFHPSVLTAHTHRNSVTDLGGGMTEDNVGPVCGLLWCNDYCGDGTPNGYLVIEGKGNRSVSYFKSTGKDRDCQMTLYQKGRIADRPDCVVAKIWNWNQDWRVRWFEDGKEKGDMSQFYSFDPDYLEYLDGSRAVDDYTPARTKHYFSARPSDTAKIIRVEAVDSYGRTYSSEILLTGAE